MFMIVDAAPVGATRFANETAIWRITAGKSGIGCGTEPIVVKANATDVDCARRNPSTSHGQSAVFSVAHSSERLPTWPRMTQSANSSAAIVSSFIGLTRRSSTGRMTTPRLRSATACANSSSRSLWARRSRRAGRA